MANYYRNGLMRSYNPCKICNKFMSVADMESGYASTRYPDRTYLDPDPDPITEFAHNKCHDNLEAMEVEE